MEPLHTQHLISAASSVKIRLAVLSAALVDALGGPAEFKPRFSFPLITSFESNETFKVGKGAWTDDTSMLLCLARSISTCPNGFDEKDQLERYRLWMDEGDLSSTDQCFGIGNSTRKALELYSSMRHLSTKKILQKIDREFGKSGLSSNGSLMRVLPVGLAYWCEDEDTIRGYARRNSKTTHPKPMCVEACEMWSSAVAMIMKNSSPGRNQALSKLDLLHWISQYPYKCQDLRKALALTSDKAPPEDKTEREEFYLIHHPIMRVVADVASRPRTSEYTQLPSSKELPSTGWVVHTLVAALYCFFSTPNFESGAIVSVNLGDDADTVGTIYASLAGVWYAAADATESDDLFWSPKVKEWRKELMQRDVVEQVTEELIAFSFAPNKAGHLGLAVKWNRKLESWTAMCRSLRVDVLLGRSS